MNKIRPLQSGILIVTIAAFLTAPLSVVAEDVHIRAVAVVQKSALLISPRTQDIIEGSTFEVGVYLDTKGQSANTVELNLKFSPNLLTLIKPSTGTSLIAIWLEPPTYSNDSGTARLVGLIPNGVVTERGLITTLTFKAKSSGRATVRVAPTSRVLANDGYGSETDVTFDTATYSITPKPPDGVKVYSDTHPYEDKWYNNGSPALYWEKQDASDFSYELDNKPFTIPDNKPEGAEIIKSYENLPDGIWYFHLKTRKAGVWGGTTHFTIRIDTTPPAEFTPKIEVLVAAIIKRALVSFFTTDTLSGLDHYEVGIIDKDKNPDQSPGFVQTESPYQLSRAPAGNIRVMVRAFDRAGNIRDSSLDVYLPLTIIGFIKENVNLVLALSFLILLLLIFWHYLFGHHVARRVKRAIVLSREDENNSFVTRPVRYAEVIPAPKPRHAFLSEQAYKIEVTPKHDEKIEFEEEKKPDFKPTALHEVEVPIVAPAVSKPLETDSREKIVPPVAAALVAPRVISPIDLMMKTFSRKEAVKSVPPPPASPVSNNEAKDHSFLVAQTYHTAQQMREPDDFLTQKAPSDIRIVMSPPEVRVKQF